MSPRLMLYLLALAAQAPALAAPPEPWLSNASFEEEEPSMPAKPSAWGLWGRSLSRVTDWTPTRDGSAMLGYRHWELEAGAGDSGTFQDVQNVEAGRTYEFTAWVYADAAPKEQLFDRIELRLESTLNRHQVTLESLSLPGASLPPSEWTRLNVRARTPAPSLRAVLILHPGRGASNGGAVKIDACSVRLVNSVPPPFPHPENPKPQT